MRIPVDPESGVPLYRQLEQWFADAIRSGALPPGSRLPSTRALAADLGVSRVTVSTAFAELHGSGLVVAAVGSGTRVAPVLPTAARRAPTPWDDAWAGRPPEPDVIAFTGVGDPAAYPVAEFGRTVRQVLAREGAAALSYAPDPAGDPSLRRTVTQLLASQGIGVPPESVLITSGSQQALALVCQVLVRPGDTVLVEEPTYDLALRLLRTVGANLVGVPVDEHGIRVDRLAEVLPGSKLLYVTPNFQNPTGATLSAPRRRELLHLARAHDVPVFEDDFAGDLRYSGRAIPAIKSLDDRGHVLYAGTFSKLLMPGLRIGYLVVDGPLRPELVEAKQVTDLGTSLLLQRALDRFVTIGRYQANLRRTTRLYRERRDTLKQALEDHLPGATFTVPAGGLFTWVELPPGVRSDELLVAARDRGVDLASGERFYLDPADGLGHVRLNFAVQPPARITEGIARLGHSQRK
ncbi:PLP-dependent aminotransferase family protein [Cryptosporangium arvum]|uniref:MocR-like pyridoxine biosynthesis transcription factor PdxR n=1 Tax=Cryptosporangium arvum TaxID=80871 RepID=UPI000567CCCF|nr:PLP-dependent aminotransferase family protein [Cryptosporangium arvum]